MTAMQQGGGGGNLSPEPIQVKSTTASIFYPGELVEVTGEESDPTIRTVREPAGANLSQVLVMITVMPASGYGLAMPPMDNDPMARVQIDGSPAIGDSLGTQSGSRKLHTGGTGFIYVGGGAVGFVRPFSEVVWGTIEAHDPPYLAYTFYNPDDAIATYYSSWTAIDVPAAGITAGDNDATMIIRGIAVAEIEGGAGAAYSFSTKSQAKYTYSATYNNQYIWVYNQYETNGLLLTKMANGTATKARFEFQRILTSWKYGYGVNLQFCDEDDSVIFTTKYENDTTRLWAMIRMQNGVSIIDTVSCDEIRTEIDHGSSRGLQAYYKILPAD